MSTTEEELRALESTKKFLFDLLNSKETPKVPKEIRARASRCLKHYPLIIDMFVEDRHDILETNRLETEYDLAEGLKQAKQGKFAKNPLRENNEK